MRVNLHYLENLLNDPEAGVLLPAAVIVEVVQGEATDAEVLRLGLVCIRLQCVMLFAHAWGSIVNMFFGGIGDAKMALLMSTARQGYCFFPVMLLAPVLLGVMGVASAQALADLISLAVTIPLTMKAYRIIAAMEKKEKEMPAPAPAQPSAACGPEGVA